MSVRKARQTSVEPFNGESSYFGYPYAGSRLNHQGYDWDGSAYGLMDLGGNWEAGAGLGGRRNGWRLGVNGKYRSDNSWGLGSKLSYDRDNYGGYLSGNVDSNGGWGIGVGFNFRYKRSGESVSLFLMVVFQ